MTSQRDAERICRRNLDLVLNLSVEGLPLSGNFGKMDAFATDDNLTAQS